MKNNPENFKLLINIKGENFTLDNVLCEVFLPVKVTDKVKLVFKSNNDQVIPIALPNVFSIYGEQKDTSDNVYAIISAEKVLYDRGSTTDYGSLVAENIVYASPVDCKIITLLNDGKDVEDDNSAIGCFNLTPSKFFTPGQSIERSYTGEVTLRRIRDVTFTYPNGNKLNFEKHWKYIDEDENTISYSELVAEFHTNDKNEPLFKDIDDLLMLSSFAERFVCKCLGWSLNTNNKVIDYYRGNMSLPDGQSEIGDSDSLIDKRDFKRFIDIAYKEFSKRDNKELYREAIFGATKIPELFESNYLGLYASLETLIYLHRKKNNLEFIINSSDEWDHLKKTIKSEIKKIYPSGSDKAKRKLLYDKIPELNRVSFGVAFNDFCSTCDLDLSDLWPVIDRKDGISLTDIRNRLIHGNKFKREQFKSLTIAGAHLRWIVERMILSVLNWPFTKSSVSSTELVRITEIYKNWDVDRQNLSKDD